MIVAASPVRKYELPIHLNSNVVEKRLMEFCMTDIDVFGMAILFTERSTIRKGNLSLRSKI